MSALAVTKNAGDKLDAISSFPLLSNPASLLSGPNQSQTTVEHIIVNLLGALNRVGRDSNGIALQSQQLANLFLFSLYYREKQTQKWEGCSKTPLDIFTFFAQQVELAIPGKCSYQKAATHFLKKTPAKSISSMSKGKELPCS